MADTALATKTAADPEFAKIYLKAKYAELSEKASPIITQIGDARKVVATQGKSEYDLDPAAQKKRLEDARATIAKLAPSEQKIYDQLGVAAKIVNNSGQSTPFNQAAIDKQFLQLGNNVEDIKAQAGFTKKLPPAPVTTHSLSKDIQQLAAKSGEQRAILVELLNAPQLDAKKSWLPPEKFTDRVQELGNPGRVYLNVLDKVFGLPQLGPKERAELSTATTALAQKQEALALTAAALKVASGEKVTVQDLAPAAGLLRQVAGDKVSIVTTRLNETELKQSADRLNATMAVAPGTKLSEAQIAARFKQLTGQDLTTLGRQIRSENSAASGATMQLKESADQMLRGLNNVESEIVFAVLSAGVLKAATSQRVASFANAAGREMKSAFLNTPNAIRTMADSIGSALFPEMGPQLAYVGGRVGGGGAAANTTSVTGANANMTARWQLPIGRDAEGKFRLARPMIQSPARWARQDVGAKIYDALPDNEKIPLIDKRTPSAGTGFSLSFPSTTALLTAGALYYAQKHGGLEAIEGYAVNALTGLQARALEEQARLNKATSEADIIYGSKEGEVVTKKNLYLNTGYDQNSFDNLTRELIRVADETIYSARQDGSGMSASRFQKDVNKLGELINIRKLFIEQGRQEIADLNKRNGTSLAFDIEPRHDWYEKSKSLLILFNARERLPYPIDFSDLAWGEKGMEARLQTAADSKLSQEEKNKFNSRK